MTPDPLVELRALYRSGHGCAPEAACAGELLALVRRRDAESARSALVALRDRFGFPFRDLALEGLADRWRAPPAAVVAACAWADGVLSG